jgi:hypothetical protein
MTTNNQKQSVWPVPEVSCISNISQIMGNAQHKYGVNSGFAEEILMICGTSATC